MKDSILGFKKGRVTGRSSFSLGDELDMVSIYSFTSSESSEEEWEDDPSWVPDDDLQHKEPNKRKKHIKPPRTSKKSAPAILHALRDDPDESSSAPERICNNNTKKVINNLPRPSALRIHKNPRNWDKNDVCNWLRIVDFSQYCDNFEENEVTGEDLFQLDTEDLKTLTVTSVGHRKRLLRKIRVLRRTCPVSGNMSMDSLGVSLSEFSSGSDFLVFSDVSEGDVHSHQSLIDSQILLQVHYNGEWKEHVTGKKLKFHSLKAIIRKHYGSGKQIRGKDADGDLIRITRNSHLRLMLREHDSSKILKLYLTDRPPKGSMESVIPEERKRSIEKLKDPICCISHSGRILFTNPGLHALFGYSEEDLKSQKIGFLMNNSERINEEFKTAAALFIGRSRQANGKDSCGRVFAVTFRLLEDDSKDYYLVSFAKPKLNLFGYTETRSSESYDPLLQ